MSHADTWPKWTRHYLWSGNSMLAWPLKVYSEVPSGNPAPPLQRTILCENTRITCSWIKKLTYFCNKVEYSIEKYIDGTGTRHEKWSPPPVIVLTGENNTVTETIHIKCYQEFTRSIWSTISKVHHTKCFSLFCGL